MFYKVPASNLMLNHIRFEVRRARINSDSRCYCNIASFLLFRAAHRFRRFGWLALLVILDTLKDVGRIIGV